MLLHARHYATGQPLEIHIEGRILAKVISAATPGTEHWPYIAPALFDIQMNGYNGQEFSSLKLTPAKVAEIVASQIPFGVTRLCPTLTTESHETMTYALRTVAAACAQSAEVAHGIAGIHVEGPYICRADGPRGAHPLAHCRTPDWDEFQRFQEACGGRIVILTLSPEFDGAPAFIRRVADTGVIVSIGHTGASGDQVRAAVDAGARLSTHLGNGAHTMLPRHLNYIWPQAADDRLTASLIGDGHHLPPDVLKCFVRMKTPARCILVSDLSGLAGLPPGRYSSNLCDLEILPEGKLVVAGQRTILAGAAMPQSVAVGNVMAFAGVSLGEAIGMCAVNPAQFLGRAACGLVPGDPAEVVVFDMLQSDATPNRLQFAPRAVIADGQLRFGAVC